MSNKTKTTNEIELNFEVTDLVGLLEKLQKQNTETTLSIKFHYFESATDKSFYIRTEEIKQGKRLSKKLTIKYNFNNDSEKGLNKRTEMSTDIKDVDYFIKFFTIIGLQYLGSKTKIRHHFEISGLDITVDEWDTKELGNRLEIEGQDIKKIMKFKNRLIRYIKK